MIFILVPNEKEEMMRLIVTHAHTSHVLMVPADVTFDGLVGRCADRVGVDGLVTVHLDTDGFPEITAVDQIRDEDRLVVRTRRIDAHDDAHDDADVKRARVDDTDDDTDDDADEPLEVASVSTTNLNRSYKTWANKRLKPVAAYQDGEFPIEPQECGMFDPSCEVMIRDRMIYFAGATTVMKRIESVYNVFKGVVDLRRLDAGVRLVVSDTKVVTTGAGTHFVLDLAWPTVVEVCDMTAGDVDYFDKRRDD